MLLCEELGLQLNITVGPFHKFFFFHPVEIQLQTMTLVRNSRREFFSFYLSQIWSKEVFLYFTSSGLLFFVFSVLLTKSSSSRGLTFFYIPFPIGHQRLTDATFGFSADSPSQLMLFLWFGASEDFHFLSTSTIHLMTCAF